MNEIVVIAEHRQGNLRDITHEMICFSVKAGSQSGWSVAAVILGNQSNLAEPLKTECDEVIIMEDPALADYNADQYLAGLEKIIQDRKPKLIVMGHTAIGMDLAPALSVRTGIPLITDCTDASVQDGVLQVQRQMYGGKITASLILKPSKSYMMTLRPGGFSSDCPAGKSAAVTKITPPDWNQLKGRQFVEYITAETSDVDITAADILVSIGRGIGKPENIPMVQAFADAIGATLSCSRPVADKEWLPKSRQVGTSGKTVKPKVYIALGVSGAFQHQAGMKNSDTIIAVNTDPSAPIFSIAHYGIIGDIMEVIPVLTQKFKPA